MNTVITEFQIKIHRQQQHSKPHCQETRAILSIKEYVTNISPGEMTDKKSEIL